MNRLLLAHLTSECNLACKYCYELKKQKIINKNIKLKSNYNKNVEEINLNDEIVKVVLTGGEVTYFEQCEHIIEMINSKEVEILTNGILRPEFSKKG